MTVDRAIEYRITRQLLQRREADRGRARPVPAERLITGAASIVVLLVLGTVAQELMWGLLAGGAVLALGTR